MPQGGRKRSLSTPIATNATKSKCFERIFIMPKNVRDKALLDPFIAKLNVATERRFNSLTGLIDHMTFSKERLTENTERVRGHLDSDRARLHRPRASLFCTPATRTATKARAVR